MVTVTMEFQPTYHSEKVQYAANVQTGISFINFQYENNSYMYQTEWPGLVGGGGEGVPVGPVLVVGVHFIAWQYFPCETIIARKTKKKD
jgi:hypothetical protein